jgi:hypothetical protein
MNKSVLGTIYGRTIELAEDLGVPDGQEVEVIIRMASPNPTWGEGIRRSAGVAATMPGVEEAFADIERGRKGASFRDSQE